MTPPSAQVPYIGSTISLLSKAGVRYEGFLHSIDQSEASVTLDHVRVFGTEDRQCDRRVPSSTETFEFIIFRASDITELRVIDTPLSRPVPDPAIIRVQSKSAATAADSDAAAANKAGGAGPGRRRQARGPSSGRTRQRYQQQHQQQHQQPHHHQQLLMHPQPPPPPMMQHQLRSPPPQHQQQTRFRNDWYGGGSAGGGGYRGGYYPQYRPHIYQAEFAATGFMAPSGMGGGGGGGRPVMHFRRYHGNNASGGGGPQRYASSAGPSGGGGRGRQSRRPHQSDGIGQAAATPGRYFSADYDFETANAEMAKLLISASGNGGGNSGGERGPPASTDAAVIGTGAVDSTASASASASAADDSAGQTGEGGSRGHHLGYDKERSFYDDIGRVDVEERTTEAGGDSARSGGRKEAAKQNALNRETFGLSGRRAIGGRLHGNHHRGVQRRSPV